MTLNFSARIDVLHLPLQPLKAKLSNSITSTKMYYKKAYIFIIYLALLFVKLYQLWTTCPLFSFI